MKKVLPPNRVAGLGALAAAVVAQLLKVHTIPQAIVVSVALLVVGAVAAVFMVGSWRDEIRRAKDDIKAYQGVVTDLKTKLRSTRPAQTSSGSGATVTYSSSGGTAAEAEPFAATDPDPNPPTGPDPSLAQSALDGGTP